MSQRDDETDLLKPGLLGKWITQYFNIWQMRFVSDRELGGIAQDRGLSFSSVTDDIKRLWQLGWLRADWIRSSEEVSLQGLKLVDQDEEAFYYSDDRELVQGGKGSVGAIAWLPEFPSHLALYFHPFRYFVLYKIQNVLDLHIHPIQALHPFENYARLVENLLSDFQRGSAGSDFPRYINRWNNIVSLAVAAEPHTYRRIFGIFRYSGLSGAEEQDRLIRQHWQEFQESLREIGLDNIEKIRESLCIDAERLDPNKEVHILLRLTEGETRLSKVEGRLGGAIYLLTMAEMLRLSAEEVFESKLREEDELGFGVTPIDMKEQLYGSSRLIDSSPTVKNQFIRTLGLDYGIRLRWYVEGDTEYYSIDSILGRYPLIQLVNLRGNVVEKSGKGVAFRDNLRSDLRADTFSYVSLDGDRDDYIRVVRKAAEDDEICGRFFISDPDFEFANFTSEELSQIIWELAVENGATPDERDQLVEGVSGATSGEEFFKLAKQSLGSLREVGKGRDWGERLISYAWKNPEMILGNGATKTRPIVDAIQFAIREVRANYYISRKRLRVDPDSGQPIKRDL